MDEGVGLLLVLVVVVCAGLAVYGGAVLAAAVNGHGLHLAPGDTVRALSRLPHHLADPRLAWPAHVRASLPGPVVYWVAQSVTVVVMAAVVVGAAFALRSLRRTAGAEKRVRLGVDTEARFASRRDIAPLVVKGPMAGRLMLGTVAGRSVATEDPGRYPAKGAGRARQGNRTSVAMCGPTQCGKSTTLIAAILDWEGPQILGSVKADLLARTGGARARRGDILIFDPLDTTGCANASWSPLPGCDTASGAQRFAHALAQAAPSDNATNMDFFSAQAEGLMWALLHLASPASRLGLGMIDVVRWVLTQSRPDDCDTGAAGAALRAIDTNGADADTVDLVGSSLEAVWKYDDRTRGSIYATATNHIRPWLDSGVRRWTRSCDVDLKWLTGGENTLYVCQPMKDAQRLAPVFGGIYGDLVDQVYARYNTTGEPLDPQLHMAIDEAANTPLGWLPQVVATCAGIGLPITTVWQSVAQIEAAYNRLAGSVLTNHGTKLFFAGLSDEASLNYVSRLLGDEDVVKVSLNGSSGARGGSVGQTTHSTKLVPLDVIRQVRPGEGVLIHGTLRPAHLTIRRYYRDPRLRYLRVLSELPYKQLGRPTAPTPTPAPPVATPPVPSLLAPSTHVTLGETAGVGR